MWSYNSHGSIKINDSTVNNDYEILIRPDAFTIPKNNNQGIDIEILRFKYRGQLTEIEIKDNIKGNNIKFLIYSNVFEELRMKNKLLFNKDWAFVFPNK